MKDDLLIRFIDGNTTPEETELVLKELSQDGEAAREWMQMVQGARLAGTKPLQNMSSDDFVARILAEKQSVIPSPRKVIRLPWLIGGISAVAASVAIVATVMFGSGNNDIQENIVAESVDSAQVQYETDEPVSGEIVDVKEISGETLAEVTGEDSKTEVKEEPVTVPAEQNVTVDQPVEISGRRLIQDSGTATASKAIQTSFEMVKPAKTPYRVKVSNPDKEFVFEWKMTGAGRVRLSIADSEGKVIFDDDWIAESSYGIKASDLMDKGELDWTLEAIFDDGSMQRKTGKIELVSATR